MGEAARIDKLHHQLYVVTLWRRAKPPQSRTFYPSKGNLSTHTLVLSLGSAELASGCDCTEMARAGRGRRVFLDGCDERANPFSKPSRSAGDCLGPRRSK